MNPRLRVTAFATLATFLGSLSLLPIFVTYGWIPRVLLVVLAVGVTSAVAQRVRALVVVAPLLTVAVVAALITLLYAHTVAPLGFVPGPAALHMLRQTLSDGFTDTTQMSAPVPLTRGLSLITTGGVGLVAIVVETLATGLRRPAIAGLPLLAIFTVPAAILNDGVGWRPFAFAAAGYLALLLAEGRDRISRWGRPIRALRGPLRGPSGVPAARGSGAARASSENRTRRASAATAHLTQVGRRVGAAAIGVAVVVPVIIPGLHSGWFGTHHTNGIGLGGNNAATSIDPIVSMRRDLTESTPQQLFTYTTTGQPDYLRMITLDKFDGENWTPAAIDSNQNLDADKQLPAPYGVSIEPTGSVKTNIIMTGLREPYLPVPMVPTTVDASGSWIYNPLTSVVFSKHSTTIRLSYQVESDVYQPSAAFLNSTTTNPNDPSISSDLDVPSKLPPQIAQQADAIVQEAHATTPYEKALALQKWFRTNFTYDLSVKPGSGTEAVLAFLRDRSGYCEQFAATMALMARIEGIPARVDVGFTPGTKIEGTDAYVVTTADAHSWPELYFAGAGWLRFEPTPRSDGQTTQPGYTTPTAIPTSGASITPGGSVAPNQNPTLPHSGGPTAPHGTTLPGDHAAAAGSHGGLPIGWLVVLLLLVAAGSATPALGWQVRRRRWSNARTDAERAHAAWADLTDDMRDLGIEWHGMRDTPRRAAAALLASRRLYGESQHALSRLARAEELARYASPATHQGDEAALRADYQLVRQGLFASAPRIRRLKARLAPASARQLVSGVASDISAWARDRKRRVADAALDKLPAR